MSAVQFMKCVLVVAGIAALIKGVLLVLWPAQSARVVRWWLGLPVKFLRTLGGVMIVMGLLCIGVAAVHSGNWLITATSILGTLCVLGGSVYQNPATIRHLAPVLLGGVLLARIWGVICLLIAGALLLIALR